MSTVSHSEQMSKTITMLTSQKMLKYTIENTDINFDNSPTLVIKLGSTNTVFEEAMSKFLFDI